MTCHGWQICQVKQLWRETGNCSKRIAWTSRFLLLSLSVNRVTVSWHTQKKTFTQEALASWSVVHNLMTQSAAALLALEVAHAWNT